MFRFSARCSIAVLACLACMCVSAAQAQTITALSASTLAQAGRLKITGSGFGTTQGSSVVMVGGASAPASTWSSTSITAYVPDSAPLGVDQVQILTSGGDSNTLPLTVTARQSAGRVVWRFQADGLYIQGRPGIGLDGTVYALDVGGHLYALTPGGGVKWIFNTSPVAIQSVDVGPDHTVYFGAGNTVYALNPDGTLKWKITDTSGAPVDAGPTVGPDGNIYAVTQDAGLQNGLGAITLSPAGQILSNHPGFVTGRGDGFLTREIAFGPTNRFYFVMNNVFDHTNGLQFFELGGNFLFAVLAGGSDEQPTVDPGGNIYSNIATNQLGVFDSDGNLLRSSFFGSSLTSPALGADGTVYTGENFPTAMLALSPDLSVKWKLANSIGYFGGGPAVNSSNAMVVVGVNGIGTPSVVQGIDATSGKLSWQVDLPAENGGFVRPMSRPRFSADARVYIGMDVNDGAADVYTYLYAINTAAGVSLSSLTLNPAKVKGGTPSEGTVTLSGLAPAGGVVVKLASSDTAVARMPSRVTVPAGASSATFIVSTKRVAVDKTVVISGSLDGLRRKAKLTVTP